MKGQGHVQLLGAQQAQTGHGRQGGLRGLHVRQQLVGERDAHEETPARSAACARRCASRVPPRGPTLTPGRGPGRRGPAPAPRPRRRVRSSQTVGRKGQSSTAELLPRLHEVVDPADDREHDRQRHQVGRHGVTRKTPPGSRMIAKMASIWLAVLTLPHRLAGMTNRSAAATMRSPETANSRAMITIATQAGSLPSEINATSGGRDQQLVGQRVEKGAQDRLLAATAGEVAVQRVGGRGYRERRRCQPRAVRHRGQQEAS